MSSKKKTGVKSIVSPGKFIMVSVDDETYQLTPGDKNFAKVEALVKQKKWEQVFGILGSARNIKAFTQGNIKVEGNTVFYKDKPVNNYVGQKLVAMMHEGNSDFQPLARFLDKLLQSQHIHVQEHLYKFLEHGNIPITADGDFLGYKRVRNDFKDSHSGKYDNSPGNVVQMPRSEVVEDPGQACSSGLHVGVKQYVDGFSGERTVVVKVDPRNVVSVPYDYDHQKMRTCEYYVVAELQSNEPLTSEVYHVTDEQQAKATKKPATIEKYVSSVGPLRDSNGRFIKKVKAAVNKGPQRDANGRFIKKNNTNTSSKEITPRLIESNFDEDELDGDDRYDDSGY